MTNQNLFNLHPSKARKFCQESYVSKRLKALSELWIFYASTFLAPMEKADLGPIVLEQTKASWQPPSQKAGPQH